MLVIMQAFADPELQMDEKYDVMLMILYEDLDSIPMEATEEAIKQGLWFLDCGQQEDDKRPPVKVMDWEQDESLVFPAVNKVAGREVRAVEYMHWWTFMGYFMEIDDGTFFYALAFGRKRQRERNWRNGSRNFTAITRPCAI